MSTVGTARVYWDDLSEERGHSRYYGFAEIAGQRYRISGDVDTSSDNRCVRLVFRVEQPKPEGRNVKATAKR